MTTVKVRNYYLHRESIAYVKVFDGKDNALK